MGAANPMFMILMMFGVFYFILIRPQAKRQKEHQAMLAALGKGDSIVTRGGLIGKITGVKDNELIVELQEKVRVRVLRSHVDGKYDPKANAKKDADKKAA
jgi:preprotein translocase subunit YajC